MRVVEESGAPISGVTAKIWYYIPSTSVGETIAMTNKAGLTDSNGVFAASQRSGSIEIISEARKDGYYGSGLTHEFAKFRDNDPEKWDPHMTLTLKKINRPIPMCAKRVNLGMPAFDKPVGFDFSVGDFVAPFGKGTDTDIIFTGQLDKRTEFDSDYKLVVSFPNTGDGIQEFYVPDAEKGSDLRSPHEAPPEGYQPQWVQTDNRKPGQLPETNQDPNRNYFLRIHTILNPDGRVKSALYGKIYGDFMQFRYYLNPTPNDRNIEFDPKQNLLKGLKSFEQVSAP